MKMSKLHSVALASVVFAFAGSIHAQTITTSYNFGSSGTPLDSGVPFTGSLDRFNTNLGTLNSIDFRLIVNSVGGSGTGTSAIGAPADTMDFVSSLTVRVNSTSNMIRDELNGDRPELTVTSSVFGVSIPGNGGSSGVQLFPNQSDSTGWLPVELSKYSLYQSVGPSTFTVTTTGAGGNSGTSQFTTTGGTVETSIYTSPDYYGTIEVRYNYTAIPEPSAAALAGLAAFGFFIRRRR